LSVRSRLPLLAAGAVCLLGGLYAALVLLDLPVPDTATGAGQAHGPVMVFGFVGTLVGLERAVALGSRWGLLAPSCSALGALTVLAGIPGWAGPLLLAVAAVALLGVYRALWARQASVALLAQAAGALCWYVGTLLWLGGTPIEELVPWLAGFVVLTIAGERRELADVGLLGRDRRPVDRWFLAATSAVLAGATAILLWPANGAAFWGLALLGVVGWLAVFDVARRTVRGRGLPRYVAVGLLAGYAWLAVAGLLWAGGGPTDGGPRYDAVLHAVFLGFTMSMIFAHAPVILPAVLRRRLPYHPVLYLPLGLLHLSLVARVGFGDGVGWVGVWRWAAVANEVAVVGFAGCAAILMLRARRGTSAGAQPHVTRPPMAVAS
jgi:hypothetical protein